MRVREEHAQPARAKQLLLDVEIMRRDEQREHCVQREGHVRRDARLRLGERRAHLGGGWLDEECMRRQVLEQRHAELRRICQSERRVLRVYTHVHRAHLELRLERFVHEVVGLGERRRPGRCVRALDAFRHKLEQLGARVMVPN